MTAAPVAKAQGGTAGRTRTWWHQIRVNGVSMHDAVMAWWNGTDTSKQVHKDCFYNAQPSGNWSAPGVPHWPGSGTPPPNPDKRMPWYTSRYNCNPTCAPPFCLAAAPSFHSLDCLRLLGAAQLLGKSLLLRQQTRHTEYM